MPSIPRQSALIVAILLISGACRKEPEPLGPTDPGDLLATLHKLADFGEKRSGTAAGIAAGDYIHQRFRNAGLTDVRFDSYAFPQNVVSAASFNVSIDGAAQDFGFDPLENIGGGNGSGEVVFVGKATSTELQTLDLNGKVALITMSSNPHRAAQFNNVSEAGAMGAIFASVAPNNLRQVGSVRLMWGLIGTIPAVTIGADDAEILKTALTDGAVVNAAFDVSVTTEPAVGRNVLGFLPGTDDAEGMIVIGAHYDTWYAGSTDNGGGVAAILAIAERLQAMEFLPRYNLAVVAFDGEELALYGGYDFMRRYLQPHTKPILAVLNLELPSAKEATMVGLGHSDDRPLDREMRIASLHEAYTMYVDMKIVPELFGGVIPTDIQGLYRGNVAAASTAVSAPYYHTTEDTPDKVDVDFLASAVDAFTDVLIGLQAYDAVEFLNPDPALWRAVATVRPRGAGDPLLVDVELTNADGIAKANTVVEAALFYDDFYLAGLAAATTDAGGQVTLSFPADIAELGNGQRFVHIQSGPVYPLVEVEIPAP